VGKEGVMRAVLSVLILASVLMGGAAVAGSAPGAETALSGTITVSGAWALYPMVVRWAEEFQKLHPAVRVDIAAGGAGKGMADALAGVVDLGMISRDIHEAEVERGAWWVSVTKDAVVPVVSESNPAREDLMKHGLSRDDFLGLWITGEVTAWNRLVESGPPRPVNLYTLSDACGAAQTWAEYLGAAQEDLLGVGVYGDPGLADAVKRDALGVGFNNINYVYDATTKKPVAGLAVVPIDLNADGRVDEAESFYADRDQIVAAIGRGAYPSPPARNLHLASNGPPRNELVRAFLEWILTDGQAFVSEAGYIALPEERLAFELAKLGAAPEGVGTGSERPGEETARPDTE
jgi:phosphate transport system substrate-binding protein